MSKDVYHEILLHVTWHTKESRRLICTSMEPHLHGLVRAKAIEAGGVYVHQVGGTGNHVHLAARVPPTLLISEWIGRIKGAASHDINAMDRWACLSWQSGYGVVTFGAKDLAWVVDYVRNQKEHHRMGKVFDRLESIQSSDDSISP